MLWKLSLTGIKARLKDYIVLFSGLVMASAIFYMFESMASNEAFLKSNSIISMVVFVFRFGSVLLGIITFAYILYANSFLMAMRQKDYAMFMMLGAKGRKIAQMIFIETFMVGIVATAVGSILGIGLASGVNTLLVNQLNLQITHYAAFSPEALIVTVGSLFDCCHLQCTGNCQKIDFSIITRNKHAGTSQTTAILALLANHFRSLFLSHRLLYDERFDDLPIDRDRHRPCHDRSWHIPSLSFGDHRSFIPIKEERYDRIEKVKQFHLVAIKLSDS